MKYLRSEKSFKYMIRFYVLLLLCSGQSVHGHGGGGDIALFSTNDQVDIGFAILDDDDINQEFFDPHESVFLSVLLPLNQPNPAAPWNYGSREPGFDANEGELPQEADINYNLLELWYWDGSNPDNVSFSPAMGIMGGTAPGPGKSSALGGFHSHPYFGVSGSGGLPAEGVYVGKLTVSVEELTDSDPYYMVSLVTSEVNDLPTLNEQVALAEEIGEQVRLYAEDPVGNPAPIIGGVDYTFYANAVTHVREIAVPEPGSCVLVGMALWGISFRRIRVF